MANTHYSSGEIDNACKYLFALNCLNILRCSTRHFSHCHYRCNSNLSDSYWSLGYTVSANSMQFALYITYCMILIINNSQATEKRKHRDNLHRVSELGEVMHLQVPQLLFLWVFKLVFTNFACILWPVCLLDYMFFIQCSFPFIYYSWHCTINSQTTYTYSEIMYVVVVCERGIFSHFYIQNLLWILLFLLELKIFCRCNMTFKFQILGRMIIQATPAQILEGDISPPPPTPGSTPMVPLLRQN